MCLALIVPVAAGASPTVVPTPPVATGAATVHAATDPVGNARQMLVVTAPAWTSTAGTLRRYQRADAAQPWQAVGEPLAVSLGRAGLGWGRGLHGAAPGDGPTKAEGDGRAPAGVFTLPEAFGYQDADSPAVRAIRLPYRVATAALKCVDDPASTRYNRIVDSATEDRPDWSSAEDMRRGDHQYALGVVVGHNVDDPVAGAGSCIFLHVRSAPGQPTVGCTAAAAPDVAAIVFWLDPRAAPVLVQLPQAEYLRRRVDWGLP